MLRSNLGISKVKALDLNLHNLSHIKDGSFEVHFLKPMPTGRLTKWEILLIEFDIIYVAHTVMKAQALVYHLADNPVDDDYEPLDTYFPDEEIKSIEEVCSNGNRSWQLYFDIAINAKGTGIRSILI